MGGNRIVVWMISSQFYLLYLPKWVIWKIDAFQWQCCDISVVSVLLQYVNYWLVAWLIFFWLPSVRNFSANAVVFMSVCTEWKERKIFKLRAKQKLLTWLNLNFVLWNTSQKSRGLTKFVHIGEEVASFHVAEVVNHHDFSNVFVITRALVQPMLHPQYPHILFKSTWFDARICLLESYQHSCACGDFQL